MAACGNPECGVSSGIHEHDGYPGFTFGSGNLGHYGYWEHPCAECAREHERLHPEDGPCWPFTPEDRDKMFPPES